MISLKDLVKRKLKQLKLESNDFVVYLPVRTRVITENKKHCRTESLKLS